LGGWQTWAMPQKIAPGINDFMTKLPQDGCDGGDGRAGGTATCMKIPGRWPANCRKESGRRARPDSRDTLDRGSECPLIGPTASRNCRADLPADQRGIGGIVAPGTAVQIETDRRNGGGSIEQIV